MVGIDEIIDMLVWNRPEEVQKEGLRLAREVKCLNAFVQPCFSGYSKNVWDNCALVLAERSDEELQPVIIELFRWLEDMNWPGAECIYDRLKRYQKNDMYYFGLNTCMTVAKALHETAWITVLEEFR